MLSLCVLCFAPVYCVFILCIVLHLWATVINNRREKLPDDKQPSYFWRHVYFTVRSEHCDWSSEKMTRQLDFCGLNLSAPTFVHANSPKILSVTKISVNLIKTPKQVQSFGKIKWLMKYTILRRFWFI